MQAQDIGMWEYILSFVSLLSVLTNALIMAFHSAWIRNKIIKIYGNDDENQILVARLLFVLIFEVSQKRKKKINFY